MKYKILYSIFYLLSLLPLRVHYFFSDMLFPLIYYIIRYRRRLVRENLRCSFPEKSEKEILRIEKAFYRNLCDVFIEAFKCLNISDEEMRRRVEVLNCELPERIASEGKNVFMLLGHLGCWEWYQEVSVRYKQPKKGAEIYKQIESPYFASLMHEIRSRWNTEQIEMKQTVRTMLQWKVEGEPFLCGFIQDQRPDTKARDCVTFLSQQTWYAPGAGEIAHKIGAVPVYLDVERTARGHYRLTFMEMKPNEEESLSPYPMSRCYWRLLEQTIQRQPELWLWSHNRWQKWALSRALKDRIKDKFECFKRTKTT
jgi:KDO2-lipid IV(A) lauroyltransferase